MQVVSTGVLDNLDPLTISAAPGSRSRHCRCLRGSRPSSTPLLRSPVSSPRRTCRPRHSSHRSLSIQSHPSELAPHICRNGTLQVPRDIYLILATCQWGTSARKVLSSGSSYYADSKIDPITNSGVVSGVLGIMDAVESRWTAKATARLLRSSRASQP